jgi:hypothetical protein
MNPALALILVYIVITIVLQFAALFLSWLADQIHAGFGLMTFVVLFLSMFWLAWPIAVRLSGAWVPDTAAKPGART